MKFLYLIIIIAVAGMIVLATQIDTESVKQENENARKMIGTILDSGAQAVFDPSMTPPTVEFLYQEVEEVIVSTLSNAQVQEIINALPDGDYKNYVSSLSLAEVKALFDRVQKVESTDSLTEQEKQIILAMESQKSVLSQTNQTQTVIKKISTADVSGSDKQLGTTKICKIGNQCELSGKFIIINNKGDVIPAPYTYFLSIDCEKMEWCNLEPIGINEVTNSDGTWKYNWVVTSKQVPGNYDAYARGSINQDGTYYWIDGSIVVEVVK